jgi:hypothetical protein
MGDAYRDHREPFEQQHREEASPRHVHLTMRSRAPPLRLPVPTYIAKHSSPRASRKRRQRKTASPRQRSPGRREVGQPAGALGRIVEAHDVVGLRSASTARTSLLLSAWPDL